MPILLPITLMFILPFGILFDSVLRHADRESSTWQAVARIGVIAGILAVLLTTLYGAMFLTSLFDTLPFGEYLLGTAFLGLPAAFVGIGCSALCLKSKAHSQALVGLIISVACVVMWIMIDLESVIG